MVLGNLALLAVLSTGLFSALFDLFQKLLGRHLEPLPMVALLGIASLPLFALPLFWFGLPQVAATYWWPALIASLLHFVSHLAFIQSVRMADFSLTVPLLSLTPAFTSLLAWSVLGEVPSSRMWFGILLVVGGVALLQKPATFSWSTFLASWRRGGPWLMILTAALWSLSLPLDKLAVERSNPLFHGFLLTLAITVAALATLLMRRQPLPWRELRSHRWLFWGAFVFCACALSSQLWALSYTLAGIVETVKRGLGNLLAVFFGRRVFGEAMSFEKWLSSSIMALGVALILL